MLCRTLENSPTPRKKNPTFGTRPEKQMEEKNLTKCVWHVIAGTTGVEARKRSCRTKTRLGWKIAARKSKTLGGGGGCDLGSSILLGHSQLVSMILDSEGFFLLHSPRVVDLKAAEA